jgi:hypothetical protein
LSVAALVVLAWPAAPARASQAPQAPQASTAAVAPDARPVLTSSRVKQGPSLDGEVLGDPAWKGATPVSTFWQEQPDQGQPASERTEVRVIYTEDTLYIGVVCYDNDPSSITVSDARRDADLDETDSFRMLFDTYRDYQNGFVFGTNPAGIEYDAQVTSEGQGGGGLRFGSVGGSGGGFNVNWDGAWRVRTQTSAIGWTAEFAIPFRTLRFPAGSAQTWGLNFQRNIRRRNERAYWAQIPRQYDLNRVSLAGTLVGLETPVFRTLRVTPYALGNVQTSGEKPAASVLNIDFGVDLKYNLTPSLTLDGTVNTDFAQVEVDDQQVNLDRFSLFFPEKRPFFLENAGFFSVGNPGEVDLFFSRRIGIGSDARPIPIIGGGRVSGKAGRFNVGLLNMQTEGVQGVAPSNNFGVVRISRDLPNRSSFGMLFVNRQGVGELRKARDYNRTYSVDGRLGIRQNTVVTGFLSKTATPCPEDVTPCPVSGRTDAFNVRSRTNLQRVDVNLGYQEVGDQFNPEVGFINRRGYRKGDAFIMTRFRPSSFIGIQELRPHALYRAYWGLDGMQETGFNHLDMHWQWKNGYEVHTGMNLTQEGVRTPFEIYPGVFVPPGDYKHSEANMVFFTNQGAPVSFRLTTFTGGFFGGDRRTVNSSLRMRMGESLNTEVSYQKNNVNLPTGDFTTNLVRTSVSYSFTTRAFLQALVQYNDQADLWSMNLRFGLLQAANTGLFVVYTDTRGLDDLSLRPERTDRSLIVKFSRMFDLLN